MPRNDNETELLKQISELKKKLQESEDKFHTLTVSAPVGIFLDDAQGNVTYINEKCVELIGVPAKEALNLDWIPYIHPDDREQVLTEWSKVLMNGDEFHMEYRWLHANGKVIWTLGDIVPVRGNDGEIILYIGTLTDITSRKQVEEENAQLEKQYYQMQKVESIGRLAGGISHDLNNLLVPILSYSELILANLDAEDTRLRSFAKRLLQAGHSARDLVRQLLAFSRQQTMEYKQIDINKSIENFSKLLRRTIREDIEFIFIPSSDVLMVMADVGQIEQVLMNLLVNAQYAMPRGGRLIIETALVHLDETYADKHSGAESGIYVMMAVSDTGYGMDGKTREQIFEPFFSTKGGQGTGLGLATVYGIVKQHGGNIWVYSEPENGTTFKIYLPVSNEEHLEIEPDIKTIVRLKGSEIVLLVEDNELVRPVIRTILEQQGYTVLVAANGMEALTILEHHDEPLHLLLTDVVMPEMNGKELFTKIVKVYPHLKVLYMSGYTTNVITHGGFLDKDISFIQKPFAIHDFTVKVREVLDGV